MILVPAHVGPSTIPGAGKGLFVDAAVAAGRILVAPDAIDRVWQWQEILAEPDPEALMPSTVRWFEDRYTVTHDWPDEGYINHDFAPTGLWHLGFVFAARDLAPGEEVTVDYRHLLRAGEYEVFRDSRTGEAIVGYTWAESLAASTAALAALLPAVQAHQPVVEPE